MKGRGPRVVVISGLSGAGKSSALRILEDIGFFCVDNLPVTLLPKFLELCTQSREIDRVAMVVDVREREFLKDLGRIFEELTREGYRFEVIFLESSDEVLLRRFKETRRRHPLAEGESILDGIRMERKRLLFLKERADKIIDTSDLNIHRLRETLHGYFCSLPEGRDMAINLVSFSYKYGIPTDADIMLDVRFLPNPFFVDRFRDLDGNAKEVQEYILHKEETRVFLEKVKSLLQYLIPLYLKEGKPYLTVAIGCTGGRHRSVCIVNYLHNYLKGLGYLVNKRHRDMDR